MKTLYLDLSMGAAGDMLAAALFSLTDRKDHILQSINSLPLPGLEANLLQGEKCGIRGLRYQVLIHGREEEEQEHEHGHHHHSSLGDIRQLISSCPLPEAVIHDALEVYRLLAQAESKVHGQPVEQIHFHEVGSLDAVADILSVCLLIHELAPERICASPVHVGSGTVRCAHGLLPVPAPATAELLRGIPCYSGEIKGELCTPTGAALLKYFVQDFGPLPLTRPEHIGCGLGSRDFPQANCLRAFLGEQGEEAVELSCNVDDMSGEAVGFALEQLMAQGALDACWESLGMKKGRPGLRLTVLCAPEDREKMLSLIFRHTSTIGVRETLCRRYILRREKGYVQSPYGPVSVKRSSGYGVEKSKPEYEQLKSLALEAGITLDQARDLVDKFS